MNDKLHDFIHSLDKSAFWTLIGIVILFSVSVGIVLFAPHHIDPSWTEPTTPYMRQIYEIADPHVYISSTGENKKDLEFVYHVKRDFTLLAFQETETLKILTDPSMDKFVTRSGDKTLKLTSKLLLLRQPELERRETERVKLQARWVADHPTWMADGLAKPDFKIVELYESEEDEAFVLASTEGIIEDWVDKNFEILDEAKHPYHKDPGVIYVNNPIEYRVKYRRFGDQVDWRYSPTGELVKDVAQLQAMPLGFKSRKELIEYGEHVYAVQGCWYCHTDQTRTLVQDVVLNGSDSFPAPPSSANEYIYQKITFPGTKRNGPDLSRVGIKKPTRDWHMGHFWSPKTASKGSIMPAFQHFFDDDPRGTSRTQMGVPNHKFEAIYQYLMTKGTRITPPTEAWWLGKDPVKTIEIIEGRK